MDCFKDQTINLASKPDKERTGLTRNSIWLGDNQTFYLTRVSRGYETGWISVRIRSGEDSVKAIIEERLNTSMETRPLAMTDNGKELIHWSERDGWAHLYLYDAQGNLKTVSPKGLGMWTHRRRGQ